MILPSNAELERRFNNGAEMIRMNKRVAILFTFLIFCLCGTFSAQDMRKDTTQNGCNSAPGLNGVYRINVDRSDKLYSVIEGVSSRVPYSEQQQFFMDLAVRLTPPDLLAIECRGNRVSLGSSRAARVEFVADGVTRSANKAKGNVVRSRIGFERGNLIFTSTGGSDDNLNFTFTLLDNGQSLRVMRRISNKDLIEPVVIESIYEKINETAMWDIFENAQVAGQISKQIGDKNPPEIIRATSSADGGNNEADVLRKALNEWIAATNALNIEKQMSFYMPQLKAFYLTRNVSENSVRLEKARAFAAAKSINIRAAEPEIIFQDSGQTAVMRFRKKYNIENASRRRNGEVVQELRWQKTGSEWRIFSERDIKVIR
jgi:ketosteroid isomerase-like protein